LEIKASWVKNGTISKLLNFPNIAKEETIQEKVTCPKAHRLNTHQNQKQK